MDGSRTGGASQGHRGAAVGATKGVLVPNASPTSVSRARVLLRPAAGCPKRCKSPRASRCLLRRVDSSAPHLLGFGFCFCCCAGILQLCWGRTLFFV